MCGPDPTALAPSYLDLEAQLAAAEARLPEGMKHCTIRFEQCAEGHGWLTATNWVVQVCPTCRLAAAEARVAELEGALREAVRCIATRGRRLTEDEARVYRDGMALLSRAAMVEPTNASPTEAQK